MRTRDEIKAELRTRMQGMRIIDAHEHLVSEKTHLEIDFNVFHLFEPYVQFDLYSSGMPKEWLWNPPTTEAQLEEYWKVIGPLWKWVKHGSYAKAVLLALKEFWDIDDITDSNYRCIGDALNQTNREGLYEAVLVKKCGIDYVLNQQTTIVFEEQFMLGHVSSASYTSPERICQYANSPDPESGLDAYCEYVREDLRNGKKLGAVLVKFAASSFEHPPLRTKAVEEFAQLKKDPSFKDLRMLDAYLCDMILSYLPELNLVAAVHTGVWGDIRRLSPGHLFGVVEKHPDVNFDVYHMGMPFARECGFLGKNYPNVYLNLCWSHIVSPAMVVNALEEWLDTVPVHKIFGFGGDYVTNPEKVWGHLEMARDNIAEVFSRQVAKGNMDVDKAEEIIRMWMRENSARVYNLQ